MRYTFLRLVTLLGAMLLAITELLSFFERLQRVSLFIAWAIVAISGAIVAKLGRTRLKIQRPGFDPVIALCAVACAAITATTAVVAIASPPNSTDAMAYHMPRVIYWAEQSSVRFFPTPYLPQIMLQPFAEYAMLHLYVLAGNDGLINLVQWFASVVSICAVSLAASLFGASPRGQAIAALFCATLPSGILASSGAKNDHVLAMWMLIAVCFAIRFASTSGIADALFLGSAIGLAVLTKGTAYLFLPCLVVAGLLPRWRPASRRDCSAAVFAVGCALAINTPHFTRDYRLSGSILGFDSAQADGVFRWRNDTFGWKPTYSNLVRHISEQLGARNENWNHGVYRTALSLQQRLGIDPNDPATTWKGEKFEAPTNANHEANAPNRWHGAILLTIACLLIWRSLQGNDRRRALYMAALFCSFLAFCAYLKWQPFMSRLVLPLFVAAAPMAGIIGDIRPSLAGWLVQIPFCLLLLDNARLPLLQNWTRPLTGSASILSTSRRDRYFSDLAAWKNQDSYRASADLIASTGCDTVAIDISNNQLEYPLMALVREQRASAQFLHTGVSNASHRYAQPVKTPPCLVACLDCRDDVARLRLYKNFPQVSTFGRFVLLY